MLLRRDIPNLLTYGRILAVPAMMGAFYLPGIIGEILAGGIFILAAITDWLDGYLSRRWDAGSKMGRMLDPIADKLLVAAALLLLVDGGQLGGIHVVPAIAILFREIFVSGLREFLAEISVPMPVSHLAKWKTGLQMVAITLLLLGGAIAGLDGLQLGRFFIWMAALLTVYTGWAYLQKGMNHV